jgi:hypothetical protein
MALPRATISRRELRRLLLEEFEKRQARRCAFGCSVPEPFYRPPPTPECSNWQLRLRPCARGCDTVIHNIREAFKQGYNVVQG